MTATYVPTPTALVNVTEPVDTEPRTVASVTQMTRTIADGVMHVQSRTDVLADLAALAAILVPTDGLVRHVLGFGMYVFKTSATTGLSPFRVAAGDATAGGWKSSTAHETTLTRMVPASLINGISGSAGALAQVPGTSTTISFIPLAAGDAQLDVGSFYCNRTFTGATNHQAYQLPLDGFLIDGATLASATLYFRPTGGHAGVPSRLPKLAIYRVPVTGYLPTPSNLLSTGSGFATFGTPASAALYQVDNTLVFTTDQNNVIDRTQYRYFAEILDDAGTNAIVGNAYHALGLSFTTIPDARRS